MIVRRSAVKMWLLAMAAIPLLILSIDVLTNRRITDWLRGLVFPATDTQLFEPRDVIWAVAMLIFALALVGWGLKELFVPTKVLECRPDGLVLRLRGPWRGPDLIAWGRVLAVSAGRVIDEGDRLPLVRLRLADRNGLPEHPWGARWVEPRVLGVLAEDWAVPVDVVVESIRSHLGPDEEE